MVAELLKTNSNIVWKVCKSTEHGPMGRPTLHHDCHSNLGQPRIHQSESKGAKGGTEQNTTTYQMLWERAVFK